MKKGFTILELLVASLLLGMLVTILTMLFNQSSISWRTGVAGVSELSIVRENIAELREEADNAYVWNDEIHRIIGLWDENGDLRKRAWDVGSDEGGDRLNQALLLKSKASSTKDNRLRDFKDRIAIRGDSTDSTTPTYTVNVKSAGPDREFDTWDDIWSFPDEFD